LRKFDVGRIDVIVEDAFHSFVRTTVVFDLTGAGLALMGHVFDVGRILPDTFESNHLFTSRSADSILREQNSSFH